MRVCVYFVTHNMPVVLLECTNDPRFIVMFIRDVADANVKNNVALRATRLDLQRVQHSGSGVRGRER